MHKREYKDSNVAWVPPGYVPGPPSELPKPPAPGQLIQVMPERLPGPTVRIFKDGLVPEWPDWQLLRFRAKNVSYAMFELSMQTSLRGETYEWSLSYHVYGAMVVMQRTGFIEQGGNRECIWPVIHKSVRFRSHDLTAPRAFEVYDLVMRDLPTYADRDSLSFGNKKHVNPTNFWVWLGMEWPQFWFDGHQEQETKPRSSLESDDWPF